MDSSILSDVSSDPFASPSSTTPKRPKSTSSQPQEPDAPKTPSGNPHTRFDAEEAREAALRRELEGVRNINTVIENVIATLDRAKGNMGTVSQTVTNASTLLNTWTRILSQTEHNQRLIQNPNWKGATADMAEVEAEERARQAAAERRALEEERRREEVRRRAEEEEMRRAAVATAAPATRGGTRGRARGRGLSSGYGRGGYSSGYGQSSGYGSSDNTASSIGSGRGTSANRRGLGSSRAGRGRAAR
ncbi:hypothetical protein NKR19_g219 [Coniochaeta hoffmannii]|uniref:DASH complex subunit DUO1 n=1 Tax=Coniochaeta hoffmannii TaxID=91930 RepID=A0AA38SEL7_9PEZI|nr:hypothetical protein NKR19_g219 [Coniochaeta hoffmannii]